MTDMSSIFILYLQSVEELGKQLSLINAVLQNDDNETSWEVLSAVVVQMERTDVLSLLVTRLALLDWEGRKAIVSIWTVLMSYESGAGYVEQHPELIDELITGYGFSCPPRRLKRSSFVCARLLVSDTKPGTVLSLAGPC